MVGATSLERRVGTVAPRSWSPRAGGDEVLTVCIVCCSLLAPCRRVVPSQHRRGSLARKPSRGASNLDQDDCNAVQCSPMSDCA